MRDAEDTLLEGGATPESADAFDRLVLGSPNSSYLWVKYVAFHLQLTELDKAREVVERALRTISFREVRHAQCGLAALWMPCPGRIMVVIDGTGGSAELCSRLAQNGPHTPDARVCLWRGVQEKERLNVWIARLNLENSYGTPETLATVFTEAQRQNEPLEMHLHLVSIYEQSGRTEATEALFHTMTRRFAAQAKVWIRLGEWKMKQGKSEQARQVLERALKSLPKPEHVGVIVQFSLLDFRYDNAERGRANLENVLSNYPKRVDVWNVFLDQELRTGDSAAIRSLFERITSLVLSSKKMKFFLKRYMDFEKTEGDAARIEHVKAKARAYIASRAE